MLRYTDVQPGDVIIYQGLSKLHKTSEVANNSSLLKIGNKYVVKSMCLMVGWDCVTLVDFKDENGADRLFCLSSFSK